MPNDVKESMLWAISIPYTPPVIQEFEMVLTRKILATDTLLNQTPL